jgi:hypothetical protein
VKLIPLVLGIAVFAAGCGSSGESNAHYAKFASEKCLKKLGQIAPPGSFYNADGDTTVVSIGHVQTKEADITYMSSVAAAKAYMARGVPNNRHIRTARKGNAILFLIQHRPGRAGPTDDDINAVGKCLA